MNLNLSDLKDALIICPSDYKNKILESFSLEKKIIDVKFLTLNEYKKNYLFDYDIKAIKYLIDQGISADNANEILENIYYIEDKKYNNEKLDELVTYKRNLEKEGLLIYNHLFNSYLNNKNIIVVGYGNLNKYELSLFKGKTIKVIEDNQLDKKYVINTFEEIEDEVEFIYNSIYDLLEKGIDINNIYVMNASSDYDAYFKRFNKYFGFNVEENRNSKLIGTEIAKRFIEMIDNNSKQEIYNYLSQYENEASKKMINILNKYAEYELKEVKDLIINNIKYTTYTKHYSNIVKKINIGSYVDDNDYVLLIGFNDLTPKMERNIDYITDDIKHFVYLPTTEEKNELTKSNTKKYISNIKNLTLSYCKNTPFKTHNKQILFDDKQCEYKETKNKNEYSEELNKAKYTNNLDKLRKFNFINEGIDVQYNTYGKNNYLQYNNKFKGLSDKQLKSLPKQINPKSKDKITLSYSTINDFYKCNFKYYLDTVLKINSPFGTYYTKLGTVCHGVLKELYDSSDFDFELSWRNQIQKEEKKENKPIFNDESEKYFIEKVKEELKKDIEIVKKQKENSQLNKQKCENNFTFEVTDKINFTGFIDKIMYKETEDNILASVIDYKTSKDIEIDKDIMKYGLSLQLPSYLYLMKHSDKFNKEVKFIGLYIQHIINFDKKYRNEDTSLEIIKKESMKLDGISTIDPDRLTVNDITMAPGQKSENIRSLSMNKDGSLKKSDKLYTDEQFEELSNIVENSVINAGNAILKGDFTINPKEIDGENKSCRYCKYASICYKRTSDLVYLSTQEEEQ